jgi:hypothetical protein
VPNVRQPPTAGATNAQAARAAAAPIFIVGPMGSGTTLMRLMLDSHPDIAIARETGIARSMMAMKSIPFRPNGAELWHHRLRYTDEQLDRRIRDFYAEMFERLAAKRGKSRWGDKTPFHLWHMQSLAHFWPHAQFVGVVRHPGATMNSTVTRFGWDWPKAARNWDHQTRELINVTQEMGNQASMCRYEDLVLEPEDVMRAMLAWLGEPWSDDVLRHHEVQGRRQARNRAEGGTNRTDPIDPARIGKWATSMPPEGRAEMQKLRPVAEFFGYSVDDPEHVAAWADPGAPYRNLMTGNEVGKRKEHWDFAWSEDIYRNFPDRPLTHVELQRFLEEVRDEARDIVPLPVGRSAARRRLRRMLRKVRRR